MPEADIQTTEPESTQEAPQETTQDAKPVEIDRASELTPRNSIDRAFEAVAEMDSAEVLAKGTQQEEPATEERERNPDGTFKAKESSEAEPETPKETPQKAEEKPVEATKEEKEPETPKPVETRFSDAPDRFSPDAKTAWAEAPEAVRAEIHRAVKEMETGLDQYKQDFEPYREFAGKLKEQGQDFKTVLDKYTGIEKVLADDPLRGLDAICGNIGTSLREVAAHVMGQTPDQQATNQDKLIRDMSQQIETMRSELGNMNQTFEGQQEQQVQKEIDDFAADKPNFTAMQGDISMFLETGRASTLQEAYDQALLLNPELAPQPEPAKAEPDRKAQTLKGQKSINGAPTGGSNPSTRTTPSTAREAIDRAFADTGLTG